MAKQILALLLGCSFFVLFAPVCASSGVPALIWSPSRSFFDLPQVYSGQLLQHTNFEKNFLDPITDDSEELVVLFIQNKLSLEDFVHHADIYNANGDGGAFHHVKTYVDENYSIQLPSIDEPLSSIRHLTDKYPGKSVDIQSPYDTSAVNLDTTRLLVVYLPDIDAANAGQSFLNNDEIISKVLNSLGDRKYTAIYTALSDKYEDDENLRFHGRHLMAASDPKAINVTDQIVVIANNSLLLYANNIVLETSVFNKTEGKTTITGNINLGKYTDLKYDNQKLVLTFEPAKSSVTQVKLSMVFSNNAADWNVANMSVEYNGKLPGSSVTDKGRVVQLQVGGFNYNQSSIWAPLGLSYHCTQPGSLMEQTVNETHPENITIAVMFNKLQLQPFKVKNNKFSEPYDCVPYFSGIIWTGIISTAILFVILYFGLSMISNIKTMEHFDDPKGKPLQVATDN